MTKIIIFGEVKLVKSNPWFSGKLASAVARGLASPKKKFILATPPPWYGDPSKLSDAQLTQVIRLSRVSTATAGMSISDRLARIKAEASGPTGLARPRARVRLPKIGKIVSIAQVRGISIPPELARAPTPVAVAPRAGIRE